MEDKLYDGYLVSNDGKIVGEARGYDPYSRFGHIMLYDVDSFGFVPGFVSKGIRLMSEEDLKTDKNLRREFEETQYQIWKRHNIAELIRSYEKIAGLTDFELFCKGLYQNASHSHAKGTSRNLY